MKQLFLFALLFFSLSINLFGQQEPESFSVEYRIELMYNFMDSISPKPLSKSDKNFRDKIEGLKSSLRFLHFDLKGSKNSSYFQVKEFMDSDNLETSLKETLLLASAGGKYYTKVDKKLKYRRYQLGNEVYWVKIKKNYGWKITNKEKIIAGYKCLKATTVVNLNERVKEQVQAWFCPQLNFNFGPKGYFGLPGLILGLEEHGFYFYATKVKLNHENINVKRPKGKIVSPKEWKKRFKEYHHR